MAPTLEQVKTFLRSKGVLSRVEEEMLRQNNVTLERAYRSRGNDMINMFTWSQTQEGHGFWEQLHCDFIDFVRNPTKYNMVLPENIMFHNKEVVKVKNDLSSDVVEISEDMLDFRNEVVKISFIDTCGYFPDNKNQDGCYYYIKEDNEVNVFTSEMFEKIEK